MENQHRKITGYRELSQAEIDVMNHIKEHGEQLRQLQQEVADLPGVDTRAAAIAKTELQTGLMWLVRAVAKPESF